jgi:hypothetical protein
LATRRRASNTSITGAVSDLQRRVRYLQAHTAPSRLSNQVVARTNIRPRAVDSDQLALRAVTNDQVAFDAIEQANLANNSVGRNEIIDGEVVRAKIGTGAVDADRLDTNSVTNSKIQNSAVTTAKLENAAVSSEKIGTSAVTAEKIRDGAVARSKIQDRAVGTSQVADSAIGSTQLDTNAVTNSKIGNGAVTSAKIGDRSITRVKIAGEAVGSFELGNSVVISTKIGNFAVTNEKIANSTIGEEKLNGALKRSLIGGVGTGLDFFINASGKLIPTVLFGGGSGNVARGNHTHTTGLFGAQTSTPNVGPSTERVKKNIEEYAPDNIKNLLNLNPKKYQYKRSMRNFHQELNKEWMHGYLVEELVSLGFPEPVGYDSEGLPASLDYGLMSMLVLELVKAQQTEIDSLQEEVSKLKEKE